MRRAALVVLLSAAAAGCGTYEERDEARGSVAAFVLDCRLDRGPDAVEALVPAGRRTFIEAGSTRAGCARILGGPATAARVVEVRQHGEEARATLAFGAARRAVTLDLGAEGWRLEGPG